MAENRRSRRTRSSAAAATTPSASQDLDKQDEDDDAALPAEEEELGSGSDAGSDSEGEEGSDADSEEGAGEGEQAEDDGEGAAADSEGGEEQPADEQQDEEDQGEAEEAEEEDAEAVDEDDADETAADTAANEEGDEQQDAVDSSEQQQQQPQQQKTAKQLRTAAATAARMKASKAAKGAAKPAAAKLPPAPKKDYSAVLELPREEQHAIVVQADKIRRFRHSARAVPACPEPKRNKTHWDHLLEEVEWMAKEFQRERGWKIKQAKRFVRAVKASKKDVESRAEVRAQEEIANIRKKATWIAKQVQGFWKKAERVVNYKVYIAIETRKRAVLDQHLDMIVGQTEAFSKMLAQNLVGPQAEQQQTPLALPAPQESPAGTGSKRLTRSNSNMKVDSPGQQQQLPGKSPAKQQQQQVKQEVRQEESEDADADETVAALAGDLLLDDDHLEPADGAAAASEHQQQQQPTDGSSTPAGSKRRRSSSGTVAVAEQDSNAVQPERPRSKRQRRSGGGLAAAQPAAIPAGAAAKGGKKSAAAAAADGDVDFKSDEEQSDDDEATLEEEERLAEADNEADNELDDLDAEANLPIEELLAKYGFVVPGEDAEQQHHDSDDEQQSDDEQADEQQEDEQQQEQDEQQEQQQQDKQQQQQQQDGKQQPADDDEDEMVAASRDAAAAQPTGFTLATTKVKTPVPFLLKGQLREYQHIGLDWLVSLYEKKINGILADEMGLGKTIQTVALLAYLACEEGVWGPHLVVVPTSVMLNWEMEFKKWCPAFKLLTYYGSAKERKQKRQGWSKPHAFHVCITSYTLVLQDAKMFRRKKWKYLILDEAHMIKNWKSQRWQTLLRFNSKRRLLITGTPLQNDLMELWSLMHFLMPAVFSSHAQFKDWFSNPLSGAVETGQEVSGQLVERLHGVLRPFLLSCFWRVLGGGYPPQTAARSAGAFATQAVVVEATAVAKAVVTPQAQPSAAAVQAAAAAEPPAHLPESGAALPTAMPDKAAVESTCVQKPHITERLKSEVEKQMPAKHEHVITCRLSKRQRQLYDEYMARAETRAVMSGGNFMGVINVLMQLRKVCNHPDLFEGRPIISAYDMPQISVQLPSLVMNIVPDALDAAEQLSSLGLLPGQLTGKAAVWEAQDLAQLSFTPAEFAAVAAEAAVDPAGCAKEAGPLYQAAAEAAVQAGLVLTPEQEAAAAVNGRAGYTRGGNNAALAAVARATDAVRQAHAQLMMTSGAAVALSSVLAQQWQKHSSWRLSRVAHAAALSLQRCGVDFPGSSSSNSMQQQEQSLNNSLITPGQLLAGGLTVSGGWLPTDACGVPVGQSSNGRFPDAAAFGSAPAASSKFTAAGSSSSRSTRLPVCGGDLIRALSGAAHPIAACLKGRMDARALQDLPSLILEISPTYEERAAAMDELLCWFRFAIPRARARSVDAWCSRPDGLSVRRAAAAAALAQREFFNRGGSLRTALVRGQLFFPDRRLLQYDCGKLIELDALLRRLKAGGHRALIFTQMAKMLDVLEAFLNLHGHVYMRLDGSTQPEQRQVMMQRFNTDTKYFVFILSTRSGGVGINLTGADTVIFYDSDWNPAMDQQAQDRCHRIGQTREVHIYRLISSNTIEENILRKSDQKRQLDWLAIQSGGFNTEMLAKLNLGGGGAAGALSADDLRAALRSAEDEDDAAAAAVAEREVEAEMAEFTAEPPPEELKDADAADDDDEPTGAKTGTRAGTPASASTVPPPPLPPKGKQQQKKGTKASKTAAAAASNADKASSPAPDGSKSEGDKAGGDSSKEGAGAETAEDQEPNAEEEARDLVAKDLAGLQEGQSGQDLLTRLSASLSPIEQYAVRHLESLRPVDVEAAAAAAVEDIKKEEWDLDAIEKRKEQQEAEAEDSEEVIEGWDKAEATAAYQAYQQQIAEVLAAEEAAAAAAAAAAAEEAEMMQLTEADFAATGGKMVGSYTYSGRPAYDADRYSNQGFAEDGGLEVTSPGRAGSGRLKREQWGWNANLPPLGAGWQQQQQQQYKKQKGGLFPETPGSSGYGRTSGRGRGRGRGRAGYNAGYNSYNARGIKDEGGDYYYYGDDYLDDDSTNTAVLWQMLEDSGSISSQCWLTPVAEAAEQEQYQHAEGLQASDPQPSLLPWEPTWDVPLVHTVAGIAASYAMSDPAAAAGTADPAAAEAAAANYEVKLESWGMFQWDHIAGQLKQLLAPPLPRTALNRRVTGASCKARYLQLLRDSVLLDNSSNNSVDHPVTAANGPNSNGVGATQQQQLHDAVLPETFEHRLGGLAQQMQPAALQLLQSVVGATNAQAALLAQEWQRWQAAAAAAGEPAAAAEADQSQQHQQQPVKLAQMQQLASKLEQVAQTAAEAANKAAAAATAAVAGISTRRQSEGVRQAVGGPTALVLAPTAAQMASIMEDAGDGAVLGAGNNVTWGAGYAAASVMSPTLLKAASNAAVLSQRHSGVGLAAAIKAEPFADNAWSRQQQQYGAAAVKQDTAAAYGASANGNLTAYGAQQQQQPTPQPYAAALGMNGGSGSGGRGRGGRGQQQGGGAAATAAAYTQLQQQQQQYHQYHQQQQYQTAADDVYQQAAGSRAGSVPFAAVPAAVGVVGSSSGPPAGLPQQQQQQQQHLLQQQQLQQLLLANQAQLQQQQQFSRTASPSPVSQQLLQQQQQAQLMQRSSASPSPAAAANPNVAAVLAAAQQQQQRLLLAAQQQQQPAGPAAAAAVSAPQAAAGLTQNQLAMLFAQQQIQQQLQAQLQQQQQLGVAVGSQPAAFAAAAGPMSMPMLPGNGGLVAPVQLPAAKQAVGVGDLIPQLLPTAGAAVSAPVLQQQQGLNPGFVSLTPVQLLQLQQQQQLAALAQQQQLQQPPQQ